MSERGGNVLVVVIALSIGALVIFWGAWMLDRTRTEFVTACTSTGGVSAFNGRHWECLK